MDPSAAVYGLNASEVRMLVDCIGGIKVVRALLALIKLIEQEELQALHEMATQWIDDIRLDPRKIKG